jgi:hypothetical protein
MPFIIGTDEAGYGPNLGPLVVAATAWQVPDEAVGLDLYDRLTAGVARCGEQDEHSAGSIAKVLIGDSKQVYRPGNGLSGLERGVHAALQAAKCRVACWRDAWKTLAESAMAALADEPWYADFDRPLPLELATHEIAGASDVLSAAMNSSGVRLVAAACRPVFPREFNERAARGGKGALLTEISLELAAGLLAWADGPAWLIFDKHGGRNFYAAAIQHVICSGRFGEGFVQVIRESRDLSVYRFSHGRHSVEAHFCTGGEAHLPVALASMTAKYLRELAMLAFNAWWCERVPGLKPTAGYPGDSRRFKQDIATAQRRLKIADELLWRER